MAGGREPRAGDSQQIQSLVSRRKSRDMLSWVSEVAVYTGRQLGFSSPQMRMTTMSSRSRPSEGPSRRKLWPGRSGEPCRERPSAGHLGAGRWARADPGQQATGPPAFGAHPQPPRGAGRRQSGHPGSPCGEGEKGTSHRSRGGEDDGLKPGPRNALGHPRGLRSERVWRRPVCTSPQGEWVHTAQCP